MKIKETLYDWLGIRHTLDFCAFILILGTFCYGVSSCASSDGYRADHGVAPCEITAPLDSLFGGMFAEGEPGAMVTVMRGGRIVYNHAFGRSRLDSMARVTDSTVFNLSSVSKLFTGVALVKMAEQGIISLDDSLSRFFPSFPAHYFDKISVRHVLTHSSGLPDLRPIGEDAWERYIETHKSIFGYDLDYRRYGTEAEYMKSFENLDTIAFEPGTHYDRRDISYVLVAPMIEAATGENFDAWMKRNIFDPAGLTETFYYHTDLNSDCLAHGYKRAESSAATSTFRSDDGRWEEYDYDEADYFLTKADRGVCSSARDFMRFKKALREGRIISAASLDTMLTTFIATDVPFVEFAMGTAVRREPGMPAKAYHMNMNGGFASAECWWPERDVDYLIFTCRNDWNQRAVLAAVDSIISSKGWL